MSQPTDPPRPGVEPATQPTRRPTVAAAEEILGGYFPVLDHGFVALVDYMGTDDSVERAARVSYGYGTRKVSATRGLIRYLRRHLHTTPSEMVELQFHCAMPSSWRGSGCHCAMPMFVARQWVRHRTSSINEYSGRSTALCRSVKQQVTRRILRQAKLVKIVEYVGERETYDLEVEGPHHNFVANGIVTHNSVNEYSGRYSLMPLLFYSPGQDQFSLQSATSNQGRAPGSASAEFHREAMRRWERARRRAADDYGWLVGENVARELARIDLPLSTYTQWYWKIDLHNLLHFLTLRVDDHAQWEIQEYGRVIAGMVKRVAPLSYEAWIDYQVMGDKLSAGEIAALSRLVSADADGLAARTGAGLTNADLAGLGLSGREIRELKEKLAPRETPDYDLDLAKMRDAQEVAAEMNKAVPKVDRG